MTLQVFAGFVVLLGTSLGAIGWIGGVVPLAMTVALAALDLLVAFCKLTSLIA
jgi:F-type H+-transporting ATPase subunit a